MADGSDSSSLSSSSSSGSALPLPLRRDVDDERREVAFLGAVSLLLRGNTIFSVCA